MSSQPVKAPSTSAALTAVLPSRTRRSATLSGKANRTHYVRNRPAVGHQPPGLRHSKNLVVEQNVQVLLLNDVLCAHLSGRQTTRPDPTPDGLRILARALRCFWHRDHCTILLHSLT